MDKFEKIYNPLFIKLKKLIEKDDNELSHVLQDKIYRKFIKDICNNNFSTLNEIKIVANDINKNVIKYDKNRWYG